MSNENLGAFAMDAFQKIINVFILAIGNMLIILGEGCIAYVKDQGVMFDGFGEPSDLVADK